ncbi:MAG: WecB/TagA/CpsF family glycosyltransferase [Candidatus Krumholzibacteria bacterium]|jgi:exopolysaccharide biosynthesis WecB/TagA/CpsF family protein|nr:WecB/TagA/CpsF family glycosyltransferase [Candidatus Krumholzibacteria bacterium]
MSKKVIVGGFTVRSFRGLDEASRTLISGGFRFALAVNPEKVMMARRQARLASLLAKADFCYPDGVGVVWAMKKKGLFGSRRIPGAELWLEVLRCCEERGESAYFLGARREVLDSALSKLAEEFPKLHLAGSRDGFFREKDEATIMREITDSSARFVCVALGSPKQELFIEKAIKECPGVLFMGLGGSFDVYTGSVRRAPALFRTMGLEWFYRLLRQPGRIFRQAVLLKFVWLVIRGKL